MALQEPMSVVEGKDDREAAEGVCVCVCVKGGTSKVQRRGTKSRWKGVSIIVKGADSPTQ